MEDAGTIHVEFLVFEHYEIIDLDDPQDAVTPPSSGDHRWTPSVRPTSDPQTPRTGPLGDPSSHQSPQ